MAHVYTIKGVKSFMGREGYGFNCDLYRNGKKIAFVRDMADGGETRFEWVNPQNRLSVASKVVGATLTENLHVEEILLRDHISTIEEFKDGGKCDMDCFVAGLVDDYENAKKEKAKCKKNILFRSSDGNLYSVKGVFNEEAKKVLLARYPDIVEFVNEKYLKVEA